MSSDLLYNHLIDNAIPIKVSAHIQFIGWMSDVSFLNISGTRGNSCRMEAFKISIDHIASGINTTDLRLEYNAMVETEESAAVNINFDHRLHDNPGIFEPTEFVPEGTICGTENKNRRIMDVCIRLKGLRAREYKLMYRSHMQGIGDTEWAFAPYESGTSSYQNASSNRRLECLRVFLYPIYVPG